MSDNKRKVLEFVKDNPSLSSKEIHEGLESKVGYATVKRILTRLIFDKLILAVGRGRGTKYVIGPAYELFYPIDVEQYFIKEIDEREIMDSFNFSLITDILHKVKLFNEGELQHLTTLQNTYEENIYEDPSFVSPLTISGIEDIHSLLIKDLGVDRNIRNSRVGISGTNYKPLDNEFQIKEALRDMCELVNNRECVFEKALLLLVLTSYIQAFGDGNKRTARIISNAILISNGYCPMSFRTIDSVEYKKAMLLFYEQNNITSFKEIFMSQFEFAVKTYF
jgi:Fic family protein